MAHIIVPGQQIHQAIDEALEVWVERFPDEVDSFEKEMRLAQENVKKSDGLWADLRVPGNLYWLIAFRLSPMLESRDWLHDKTANKVFREVFIKGIIKNESKTFVMGGFKK